MTQRSSDEQDLAQFGYKQQLDRRLSTTDLLVYGLVFMVPIAPWAIFGVVYNAAGGMVPLVYLIGLVAMIFTALSYAQMAKAFPIAGSVYSYVGRSIHPNLGFIAGWTILLDYLLVPTLLYVFAAESMFGIFSGVPKQLWIVVFLVINTGVNYVGISFTAIVNRLFLVAELLFLAIFVVMAVIAISKGTGGAHFTLTPFFDHTQFTPGLIGTALSIAVLSFLGFDGIATLSEEAKGGRRSAGIAMVGALVLVALFFVTQTWLAAMLVPQGQGNFSDKDVNNAFFGIVEGVSSHGWQIAFLAMNALAVGLANAVAAQSATSRLLFSMSRDGRLPGFLSHVNVRTKVPERAILVVGGLTLVLGLFFVGQIDTISSLVNFGALTAFLLLHVSVVVWYLGKQKSRNFFLHLVSPVIGFGVIGYVLWNAATEAKVGGIIWLVVGIGVLLYYRARGGGIRSESAASEEPTVPERHHLTKDLATTGFSVDHEPALTVTAGSRDRVLFETDDAAYAEMEQVLDLARLTAPINPITGPVRVEGAHPGDLLAVTVHDIELTEFGWSVYLPGAGALSPVMGEEMLVRRVPVDEAGVHLGNGLVVPAAPMVGCLGVAPSSGEASTVMPSYATGGNMDLTEVAPGTTVYLPVQVEGAWFSLGDVHAVMSRGESSFVAIETAATVTVSFDVVPAAQASGSGRPWLETDDEVVFVGLGDPVQESVRSAYEALHAHLTAHGWDPMDAYVAMSAIAHTELGGPTGSRDPDPLHPLAAVGAVTLARFPRDLVQR